MVRIGDFSTASSALEAARERQAERSQEARESDEEKRAPITTSYPRWASNPAEYDFPGIDTPTENPQVRAKDLEQEEQPDRTPRAKGETPADPVEQVVLAKEELSARDVSLSPDEAFRGVGATSSRELGGNFLTEGERSPTSEPQAPPEWALEAQSRGEVADIPDFPSIQEENASAELVEDFNAGLINMREFADQLDAKNG